MNLAALIRSRGLKMNWVAERIGLSESHFSEICNGRRNMRVGSLGALAEILDVSVEVVFEAWKAGKKGTSDGTQAES